jgi:hypothetical protein
VLTTARVISLALFFATRRSSVRSRYAPCSNSTVSFGYEAGRLRV